MMDLKFYLAILWGNKWVILTTMAVTITVVTVGTLLTTPIYSASTTLRVATASIGSVSYTDAVYADRLMNTYTKIATSRPVLTELTTKLNLPTTPVIKVTTINATELIQISVESPNPVVAERAANTLAEILIDQSKELYAGGGKSPVEILSEQLVQTENELKQARQDYEILVTQAPDDTQRLSAASQTIQLKEKTYETLLTQYDQARLREAMRENTISIVEPAVVPMSPSKPRKALNISLGFLVGLVGGIGMVFLFENLDTRLYTLDQIEEVTELDVIGKIPAIKRPGLSGLNNTRSLKIGSASFKESFRKLQTKIIQLNTNGHPMKSLMFTSAVPGEGKSTVIINLAVALAQAGHKVVIVDSDMRLPTQHKIIGLPNKVGLSSVLTQQAMLVDALQKSRHPDIQVLTSGPTPSNPVDLLGSPQMKALIEELTQRCDIVLLDTPAMLPVGDAAVLATIVDSIALVTRRAYSKEVAVREACKQLADSKAHTIGVVVNEAELNGGDYYYYQSR